MSGTVRLEIGDRIATVTFDRPEAHNAMTFAMYAALESVLEEIVADERLVAVVFRGSGAAFVAGTDISEFSSFTSAEEGLAYEERIERVLAAVEALPVPTIALIEGVATGGGLILACACDLRLVGNTARLGVPIARTVGNCLSQANTDRLSAAFGRTAAARMLLLAHLLSAQEAIATGFALPVGDDVQQGLGDLLQRLKGLAPLTIQAAKHMLRTPSRGLPQDDRDLLRLVYGSADFHEGVDAFLAKRPPAWRGV